MRTMRPTKKFLFGIPEFCAETGRKIKRDRRGRPTHIWLDDVREPPGGALWCRNPEAVLHALRLGSVKWLSLDHDLGLPDPRNGYMVLCEMERMIHDGELSEIPDFIGIHTANPAGRKKMESVLERIESRRIR